MGGYRAGSSRCLQTFNVLYCYFADVGSEITDDHQDLDQRASCFPGNRPGVFVPVIKEELGLDGLDEV